MILAQSQSRADVFRKALVATDVTGGIIVSAYDRCVDREDLSGYILTPDTDGEHTAVFIHEDAAIVFNCCHDLQTPRSKISVRDKATMRNFLPEDPSKCSFKNIWSSLIEFLDLGGMNLIHRYDVESSLIRYLEDNDAQVYRNHLGCGDDVDENAKLIRASRRRPAKIAKCRVEVDEDEFDEDDEDYDFDDDEGYEFAKNEVESGRQTLEEIKAMVTGEEIESARAFKHGIREYLADVECGDESGKPKTGTEKL